MKTKEPLFEIAFEQQRQIEQPAQKVVALEVLKPAGRGPQPRDDANRNVCILRKDGQLAEPLTFGLGQKVEVDANVSATALARCISSRLSKAVRPFLLSRVLASVIATGSGSLSLTRLRKKPLTILTRSGHSPTRAARSRSPARSRIA